jgi:putative MATE family efflux protein
MKPPDGSDCVLPTGPNPITADGPVLPVILALAAPSVLMMYLQNAYNIIDGIFVGRLLGKVPLAGLANGGYVLWALFGLVAIISVGLTALVARRMGEGDCEAAERAASRGIRYAMVWSVVVAVGVHLFLEPIFDMMGAQGELRMQGIAYMRMLLYGAPFIFLSFSISAAYRAAGDTTTPMWLMALSLLINTGLDPVLMLGLFGLPEMGIAGAALGTVIARFVWVVLGLWLLHRRLAIKTAGPGLRRLLPAVRPGLIAVRPFAPIGWKLSQLWQMVKIGAPPGSSMVLFPAVYMILVRIPTAYGDHQVAALRIGQTIEGMTFFLAIGVSMATATLVGQNLGAGKPGRAARFAWTSAGIVAAIVAVFSVLFYFLAEPVTSLFNPEPDTIAAGAVYLRILAWSQVFMSLEIVLGGGFNGAGNTGPPTAINIPLNLARIPLAYWLAESMGWGVEGVWWAISGTSIIKGILISALFATGRWARRKV